MLAACMQVVLVTLPGTDVDGIVKEVHRQTAQLPRGSTVEAALSHSCVVRASSREDAASISNRCLPLQGWPVFVTVPTVLGHSPREA